MSNVTRAMIMGAGLGTRMRPLTDDRPKPLVTVGGKTLIDHAIDRLVAAGVTQVVVNVHYKAAHADRAIWNSAAMSRSAISDETDELLDTGGGVVKALPHFDDEPFFILNSDSIWVEGMAAGACRDAGGLGRSAHGRAAAAGRHDHGDGL